MTLLLDRPRPARPDIHDDATRREFIVGGVAAGFLLVAGCASDEEVDAGASPSFTDGGGSVAITVDHAFGSTEIGARPARVVTVGLTEHDTVLALGLAPVGVTEWYGEQPFATWPWARDELGDVEPQVLSATDGFQYEAIAVLGPDLILGLNAGMDEEAYARLSQIAPTVAHPAGEEAYFSPWRIQTSMIGRALGKEAEAEQLVAEIDARFAAAAAAHAEFAGTRVVFLQGGFYEGEAVAYQEGLSTDFLTDLGFEIPSELEPFVGEAEGSQALIPLEQLSVLDSADVLLWATEGPDDRGALEEEVIYQGLQEVREGRLVFTDDVLAGAIYFTSPLSLPLVLDRLVPALAATLAGEGPAVAAGDGS